MNVDCRWFSAHLEGFFCESLGIEEFQRASEHLKSCETCRSSVQALHEPDPMIQQVLEYRMAKARRGAMTPERGMRSILSRRSFQFGLAGALAAAAVLAIAVYTHQTGSPAEVPQAAQTVAQNSDASKTPDVKDVKGDASTPVNRAKPDAAAPKSGIGNAASESSIFYNVSPNAPEFQVMNPEGHDMNLQDYRGRVLLFGVWSEDQPEAAQNLQRLYQAFGTRHDLRILGVSSRTQNRIAGITFPIVFNSGSRLLETANANFTVVDKEGVVRMRGSLKGNLNALIPQIKAKLDELGGK